MGEITNPAEAYFKDGLWAWDGTVWRKQPLLYGFTSRLVDRTINNALAAGVNNVDITTVPADEVWTVTNIAIIYTGTPPTQMTVQLVDDGTAYNLFRQMAPVSATVYDRQGRWVLVEDDLLRLRVTGATLNDSAGIYITGFITSIVE